MISIAKHRHHNERLVRFFLKKAYPGKLPTIEQLITDNIISGTQLSELAISKTTGIDLDEIGISKDLQDDSDVKTATVFEKVRRIKGREYLQTVAHIRCKNKIGCLRIITFYPDFDKWHYFIIPNEVRKNSKQIWILFDKVTGEPYGKFSEYQIESWEKFCEKK